MKKKRYTVEQIIRILGQVDEGINIDQACREHSIAKADSAGRAIHGTERLEIFC